MPHLRLSPDLVCDLLVEWDVSGHADLLRAADAVEDLLAAGEDAVIVSRMTRSARVTRVVCEDLGPARIRIDARLDLVEAVVGADARVV